MRALLLAIMCARCASQSLMQRLYELGSKSPYELFKASMEEVPMAAPEPEAAHEAAAATPQEEASFPPLSAVYDELADKVKEDLGMSMPQLALVVSFLVLVWSLGQHGGEWLAYRMHGAAAQGAVAPNAAATAATVPSRNSSSRSSSTAAKPKEE